MGIFVNILNMKHGAFSFYYFIYTQTQIHNNLLVKTNIEYYLYSPILDFMYIYSYIQL